MVIKTKKAVSPVGSTHSEVMKRSAQKSQAYREAQERLAAAETIARLIIHKRMELGISQSQLAERMGTTPSVISRLESGEHFPSLKTLRRIADGLETRLVVGFANTKPAPGPQKKQQRRKQPVEQVIEGTPELAVV